MNQIHSLNMLSLVEIRKSAEIIKKGLKKKYFAEIHLIDEILLLDEKKRKCQAAYDAFASTQNTLAKEIGILIGNGKKEDAEKKKKQVSENKEVTKGLAEELNNYEQQITALLYKIPNLPSSIVPEGKTIEDNVIIRQQGKLLPKQEKLPHWNLCEKYNLINFELGNKITGSGFPVYIGQGAKLVRSLIQYFIDFNTLAGYQEILPPLMVNEDSAYGTGQLPDKDSQMYFLTEDKYYLIPTAEVPLTNLYRNVLLKEQDFPIKMTGYSQCFRREAGSYGKEVRGLNRLHQFDKVEIVQITHPNHSYQILEEMINHVEKLIQSLELPYRILKLCAGDMSFASALTYDFEIYSCVQEKWLEVSSVSNFESFQSTRLQLRYKSKEGKNIFSHTLNGSSLALPRIMAGIIENFQTQKEIFLPKVLHKYFGAEKILFD
ncbi:MAG: serine--tRNA ligase [Chitinophagaceae bacterium]